MSYSKEPSYKKTEFKEPIFEVALSLGSFKDGVFIPGGTCVLVAQNIAMTAKHVVMEDLKVFEGRIPESNFTATYSMQAVQVLDRGQTGAIWNVKKIYTSETDVVFLFLEPYSIPETYKRMRTVGIDLKLPAPGERISAFGYSKVKIHEGESNKITWEYEAMTSIGEVKEVKQGGLGAVKFPCFMTNAPWENHMSGGPIFNNEGMLCGLISRSMWSEGDHIYSIGYYYGHH